jgi:hypothetical protein
MSGRTTIDASDEGKKVIDETGDQIGIVAEVEGGTAYVDPDPSMADKIMAKLGWDDADEDTYSLSSSAISEITSDEIHLRGDH